MAAADRQPSTANVRPAPTPEARAPEGDLGTAALGSSLTGDASCVRAPVAAMDQEFSGFVESDSSWLHRPNGKNVDREARGGDGDASGEVGASAARAARAARRRSKVAAQEGSERAFSYRPQSSTGADKAVASGSAEGNSRCGAIDVDVTPPAAKQPTLRSEWRAVALLVSLYLLQGIPLGLCMGSMPFLLRARLSYTSIGIFSLASYPYSLKLLWSPLVDSVFSRRLGRRRSWILPVQTLSAIGLIAGGPLVARRLEEGDASGVTACFFVLVLLAATQDIAVDGWALTLLPGRLADAASTCQTVGMNLGYFCSFTLFLALNDTELCERAAPAFLRRLFGAEAGGPLVSLAGYMRFWGWIYLVATLFVLFFTHEREPQISTDPPEAGRAGADMGDDAAPRGRSEAANRGIRSESGEEKEPEQEEGAGRVNATPEDDKEKEDTLSQAYAKLLRVATLPAVLQLSVLLLVCRLGMLPAEAIAPLKLLEKGVSKEALAGLILIEFPMELASALIAGRWASASRPFAPWIAGYRARLAVAAATVAVVAAFPHDASPRDAPGHYAALAVLGLATSFASTLMFTAITAWFLRVSDSSMGGAYLTLLNTIANLGYTLPKLAVFALLDWLSEVRCVVARPDESKPMLPLQIIRDPSLQGVCLAVSSEAPPACAALGGVCAVTSDGFPLLAGGAVVLGALAVLWLKPTIRRMEARPLSDWHAPRVAEKRT